jgi:hypothetical protein
LAAAFVHDLDGRFAFLVVSAAAFDTGTVSRSKTILITAFQKLVVGFVVVAFRTIDFSFPGERRRSCKIIRLFPEPIKDFRRRTTKTR